MWNKLNLGTITSNGGTRNQGIFIIIITIIIIIIIIIIIYEKIKRGDWNLVYK